MCRENIIWKPITYHLDLTSLLALSKWSTTRSILGILRFDHSGTLDTSHRKINACNFSLPPPFPSPNNEHNSCIIASHPFTILTPPILLKSIPHPRIKTTFRPATPSRNDDPGPSTPEILFRDPRGFIHAGAREAGLGRGMNRREQR